MTSVVNTKFAVKPVAAALALAVSAGMAYAAPTPNQMPGAGFIPLVNGVSLGSANVPGTTYTGLVSGAAIAIDGRVIIQWGGPGAPVDVTNPAGFNLGANAKLSFTSAAAGSAVLNLDRSGNPSQIFGQLDSTGAAPPSIFISNANGIIVGAGARIVVPPTGGAGLGLIGADLSSATSMAEFVGNNGWITPNPPTLGTSYIAFPNYSAGGNIEIGGSINGDLLTNTPASFIFVAGNNVNVLNTGNLFAQRTIVYAGMLAQATTACISGISNTTTNRLWNVDANIYTVCCSTLPGNLLIDTTAGVTGNVVNVGSMSAVSQFLAIVAKGNVRTGTLGDPNLSVGVFSDAGVFIDSYGAATPGANHVELYGVVSGYTTNVTLPSLRVNTFAYASGLPLPNVTVNTIRRGSEPSNITTTTDVTIFGHDVAINSTVNHTNKANGGAQTDVDLTVVATGMLNVTADIGAGQDVILVAGGNMTISGNVLADTNDGGLGGIYIYNNGAGATTTISGNLTVPTTSTDTIYIGVYGPLTVSGTTIGNGFVDIHNNGTGAGNFTTLAGNITAGTGVHIAQYGTPVATPLTISGDVSATTGGIAIGNYANALGATTTISGDLTATGGGDVSVYHYGGIIGNLVITGTVTSSTSDVFLFSQGNAQVRNVVAGSQIFATVLGTSLMVDGPWTAGYDINITGTIASTTFTPAAVLTAPTINLNGLHFRGVNDSGGTYASQAQKPVQQMVTNNLNVMVTGNINGPIVGNTNWPLNSIDVAPLITLAPVLVSVSAVGGGFQAVNIKVLGDMFFNTGTTTTPFIGVPLTTSGFPAGGLQGNLGSQLIVGATGFVKVIGAPTGSLFGPALAAQWPGGSFIFAGTTLELLTPFYNAWSTASPPFGGSFWTAPFIALNGYIATSGTAWANFSTQPVTGNPTVYQIRLLGVNSFGFEATEAFVKNDYFSTVVNGPICNITGPNTWVLCP